MIHVTVNLSRQSLWGAVHSAGYSGPSCAAQIPWLPNKFTVFSREHLLEWSCFLVRKSYTGSKEQKGDLSMAWTCTSLAHGAVHHWEIIQALFNVAWIQGTQPVMGCKIYLPPIFILLFCLTEAVSLWSHLLRNLSHWNLEKAVHSLSLPPHPTK